MTRNFGAAAQDYAKHRAGFPDSFYDRLKVFCIGTPGQVVVDIGTGTGVLGRGFAQRGCQVIGIDPDDRLLEQARLLDREANVNIDYRAGVAEALPVADDYADVVTAGTCWHWFDGPVAAREAKRIGKPGAFVVISVFAWLPLPGNVVAATERLIERHNPAWKYGGGNGFYLECIEHLQSAGIGDIETFSYDVHVPYTREGWRGRIRASAGVGASLSPAAVQTFDAELASLLERSFNTELLQVHHRLFTVIGRV